MLKFEEEEHRFVDCNCPHEEFDRHSSGEVGLILKILTGTQGSEFNHSSTSVSKTQTHTADILLYN